MYIPNTMPATADEMYEFLYPTIADGLFDSITVSKTGDDATINKLYCVKDGNTILTIWADIIEGMGTWYFIPHPATGVNPDPSLSTAVRSVNLTVTNTENDWLFIRCSGGVGFMYWPKINSGINPSIFLIGRTTNLKTAFLSHGDSIGPMRDSGNQTIDAIRLGTGMPMYPIMFGDNTNLELYINGIYCDCSSVNADRTILGQIPVVGVRGSSDCFSTLFVRIAVQEKTHGRQLLGDHYYGCIGNFAILDD